MSLSVMERAIQAQKTALLHNTKMLGVLEDQLVELTNRSRLPGEKGEPGTMGIPGEKGKRGKRGSPGNSGVQGKQGAQGSRGPEGPKGEKGDRGSRGPEGPKGEKGDRGLKELDDKKTSPYDQTKLSDQVYASTEISLSVMKRAIKAQKTALSHNTKMLGVLEDQLVELTNRSRIPGEKGEPGIMGIPGEKGERGEKCSPGHSGLQGKQGAQGSRGPEGPKGEKGDQGLKACSAPDINAILPDENKWVYATGEQVRGMTCDKGQKLVGDSTLTCLEDGTWQGASSCVNITCSDGWVRHNESCYYIERKSKRSSEDASQDCRSQNASLVIIDSEEENNFIKRELRRFSHQMYDQFWTAGNDINDEGIWVWGTSNHRIDLDFWGTGEPNSEGTEDCLTFASELDFGWNDRNCFGLEYYICEMEDRMQFANYDDLAPYDTDMYYYDDLAPYDTDMYYYTP